MLILILKKIMFSFRLIPESPRWLIAVGKQKEAMIILTEAAKKNNNPLPKALTAPNPKEKEVCIFLLD